VDNQNVDNDLAMANFKLANARSEDDQEELKTFWTPERISKYIVFVQRFLDPVLSEEA